MVLDYTWCIRVVNNNDFVFMIKIRITITWSKIVALIMLILAFILDLGKGTNGTIFIYTVPFVAGMITGRQFIRNKLKPFDNES